MIDTVARASLRLLAFLAFGTGATAQSSPTILPLGVAVTGIVQTIYVHSGDKVEAGQLLLAIRCGPLEAEVRVREGNLDALEAAFERTKNGPRIDEIRIGEAAVGVAQARAEEAKATLDRVAALREGVATTRAVLQQAQRDARVTAALLEDARRRLDLLRAGSRQEDIREAHARRDAAAAALDETRAQFDQCAVRAPTSGTVEVLATVGQFVSTAIPTAVIRLSAP